MPRNDPPRRPAKPPHRGKPAFRKPRPPAAPPREGESGDAEARDGDRLQKVLASAGLASRRECELLITEGRVEVDGKTVTELGARVDRNRQEIRVDGEPLPRPKHVYYAVHKPTGVVTTARDPAGRPRVIDLLPPSVGRVFTVGRLDLASEGLILLTNDGELANQLTHPKHGVEKTYEVQVAGQMEPDVLAQLKRGVHLSEGFAHAVHARIKTRLKRSTLLEMVLDEGRNREVRRLLARVGHKVQRLVRIAVGPIRLGDMPRGAHRRLTQEEVSKLREAAIAGPKPRRDEDESPASARPIAKKPFAKKPFPPKFSSGKPSTTRPASGKQADGRRASRTANGSASGRPAASRPASGRLASGQPLSRKPPIQRKPKSDAGGDQTVQRRVIGDEGAGETSNGGAPPRRTPVGGRSQGSRAGGAKPSGGREAASTGSGGKGRQRFAKGTKAVGRKPVKRRRPERPQRGGK